MNRRGNKNTVVNSCPRLRCGSRPIWSNRASIAKRRSAPRHLYKSNLYAGWDIARNGHHSTLWFTEVVGDVSWCRGVVNVSGMTTPDQLKQARQWMPQVAKMNVDQTGMGLTISEMLQQEYPGKVQGITFTASIKEQMAVYLRMRMEQRKIRLPNDENVRRSFFSLRRSTNRIGQARFDADADEKYGHADEFWACAMAEMAAERTAAQGMRQGQSASNSIRRRRVLEQLHDEAIMSAEGSNGSESEKKPEHRRHTFLRSFRLGEDRAKVCFPQK